MTKTQFNAVFSAVRAFAKFNACNQQRKDQGLQSWRAAEEKARIAFGGDLALFYAAHTVVVRCYDEREDRQATLQVRLQHAKTLKSWIALFN